MSPPWMPLYVADYLADTTHLTSAEHGAYLLLIMHYWQRGSLPADDAQLARIARMNERDWSKSRSVISAFFSDAWGHNRVEAELEKAMKKNDNRVSAGRAGGFAKQRRAVNPSNASSNASHLPEQNASNASSNALAFSSQPDTTSLRSVVPQQARSTPKRATRLPADWTPSEEDRQFAKSRGFSESSIDFEAQKIRNWSASSPKGACLDWPRRWENWILQAQPRAGPNRGRGPSVAEIARMDDQDFFDEPRPSSHIATESARGSEQVGSGFAGPLSERDRGRAGGGVLDLRPADAERR